MWKARVSSYIQVIVGVVATAALECQPRRVAIKPRRPEGTQRPISKEGEARQRCDISGGADRGAAQRDEH